MLRCFRRSLCTGGAAMDLTRTIPMWMKVTADPLNDVSTEACVGGREAHSRGHCLLCGTLCPPGRFTDDFLK